MAAELALPLRREDGIEFRVLTPELEAAALEVEIQGFSDEPAVVVAQPDRDARVVEWTPFCAMFATECAGNGLSIVAVDTTAEAEVVAGVFWVRDFKADLPPEFEATLSAEQGCSPNLAKLVNVLVALDTAYEAGREGRGLPALTLGDSVDLWMLAVAPAYRRRGIAAMLTQTAMAHVRAAGFKTILLEATGGYSALCARKVGMEERAAVEYESAEPAFAALAGTEHSHMRFFERLFE